MSDLDHQISARSPDFLPLSLAWVRCTCGVVCPADYNFTDGIIDPEVTWVRHAEAARSGADG